MHFDQPDTLGCICHALSSFVHCEMEAANATTDAHGPCVLDALVSHGSMKFVMRGFAGHFQNRVACYGVLQLLNVLAKFGSCQAFSDFLASYRCGPLPWRQPSPLETADRHKCSGPEVVLCAMAAHAEHKGVQQFGITLLEYSLTTLTLGDAAMLKLRSSPPLSQALLYCKRCFGAQHSSRTKAGAALAFVQCALCENSEGPGDVRGDFKSHTELDVTCLLDSRVLAALHVGGC